VLPLDTQQTSARDQIFERTVSVVSCGWSAEPEESPAGRRYPNTFSQNPLNDAPDGGSRTVTLATALHCPRYWRSKRAREPPTSWFGHRLQGPRVNNAHESLGYQPPATAHQGIGTNTDAPEMRSTQGMRGTTSRSGEERGMGTSALSRSTSHATPAGAAHRRHGSAKPVGHIELLLYASLWNWLRAEPLFVGLHRPEPTRPAVMWAPDCHASQPVLDDGELKTQRPQQGQRVPVTVA